MRNDSRTDREPGAPLLRGDGDSCATVLLVEAGDAAARAVRTSLDGVLGESLRLECVTGLAAARTRLTQGNVEVILVGTEVSDCGREWALEQLSLAAPECLVLPVSEPGPGGTADTPADSGVPPHLLPRMLKNVVRRKQAAAVLRTTDDALFDVLLEAMERAEVTLSSIGDAVLVTDAEGRVTYLNPVAEGLTGWGTREAAGRALAEVFPVVDADTREPAINPAQRAMTGNTIVSLEANCVLRRRDGGETGIEDSAAPIHDRDGAVSGAVIVFRDISQSVTVTRKMAHLAQHDPLTNLPNRVLLNERLDQAIRFARRHHKRVALLFVDLDRFKDVNDALGHVVGDHMLQAIAQCLGDCVRDTDTVSRLGGDEFVILLTEIDDVEAAEQVASKVLMLNGHPLTVDGHHLEIALSVGISIYPEDGHTVDAMLECADAAMYQAKRDFGCPDGPPALAEESFNRVTSDLEAELREALGKEQFVLHYQPLFDLASGAVVGLEALLRWREPRRGLIGADRFMALAERTGLIVPIGQWVLQEACRQIRAWQAAGLNPPPVSINVSAVELGQRGFAANVAEALRDNNLYAGQLGLEIAESTLTQQHNAGLAVLRNLREQGVGLAIDGFGSGPSSLGRLQHLPVDTIKVHGSFLRDITVGNEGAIILRALLQLGHKLGHGVVAQGVENERQLTFLRPEGCSVAQGFHLGAAGEAADVAMLLSGWPPPYRRDLVH